MEQIIEQIKDGLIISYKDKVDFEASYFNFPSKIIEYLFTVNIAKELRKIRKFNPKEDYTIHLEYPAVEFINNAFQKFTYENTGKNFIEHKIKRREKHKIGRKGRLDIAILSKPHGKFQANYLSKIAIEIKGINPDLKKVKSDLIRLKNALIASDKIGENSIEFCVSAFAKRIDKKKTPFESREYKKIISDYKKKLEKLIKPVLRNTNISPKIISFKIDEFSGEDYRKKYPEEIWDYEDAAAETGALAGIMIILKNT